MHVFRSSLRRALSGLAFVIFASGLCAAQTIASLALPDAPETQPAATNTPRTAPATPRETGPFDKVVLPGETAPRLTVFDKTLLGVKHSISPFSAAGWVLSASYEQIRDDSPNYGQTAKGYLQRLGASSARSASEGIFSDSILAPVLHEDPRYYKLGRGHSVVKRFVYAATRTLVGKTDGGAETANFSLLGGNLAGAALTQAYYPPVNRGFTEVSKTFGTSLLGSAFGFELTEFIADPLEVLHLGHSH
jgi:hypothetical protein